MNMKPVSDSLIAVLVRQGLTRGAGATAGPRGMTNASSPKALSVMGWANALLDREEDGIDQMHSPAGGEEDRRMGIRVAGGTRPPAVGGSVRSREPSPAHGRPVLRLISSRQRAARRNTSATPCLVLIDGGKA